jgi:hypothetical protein
MYRMVVRKHGRVRCSGAFMLKQKAGIWIDHRKATLVMLSPTEQQIQLIASNVEKHLERAGDSPLKGSFEAARVPADDTRERALTAELNIFYDAVVAAVCHADSVLIFGPGEAKIELKKRLLKRRLGARIAAVQSADKMTDAQIAARVRKYFGPTGTLQQ